MKLYRKIQIIFLIASFFIVAFFIAYFYVQKKDDITKKQERYYQIGFLIDNTHKVSDLNMSNPTMQKILSESRFVNIEQKEKIQDILDKGIVEYKKNMPYASFKVLRVYGDFYLYIKHKNYTVLLYDTKKRYFIKTTVSLFITSLLFLLFLYFWLMRSLSPFKKLYKKIQKVIDGDLAVSLRSNKKDEIAEVANAFDDALRKLEKLIKSRQFFLRTIMHELKTPIGKGRFLNEFLDDDTLRDGYDRVFDRLHLLAEEFSKIEKMLSANYMPKISKCNLLDVVNNAVELMILDKEEEKECISICEKESQVIDTDFELLSLAIKNLIDNAIKYSIDHKVDITLAKDAILISSYAEELPYPLHSYLEPFNQYSNGLGLGLYIVDTIASLLNLDFGYQHKNKRNIFLLSMRNEG
ncbi:MAG: HAMP domain-containing histidine kinase [Sulfurovum sp.]|nr:HAMP domain-containing histidine kinase [Sulfurovum sp.]